MKICKYFCDICKKEVKDGQYFGDPYGGITCKECKTQKEE